MNMGRPKDSHDGHIVPVYVQAYCPQVLSGARIADDTSAIMDHLACM